MSWDLEPLAELHGDTLDDFIAAATGMTRHEFAAAMANKGQQQYVVATQNSDRCNQKCTGCFMTEEGRESDGRPMSEPDVTDLLQTFKGRGYQTYMYYQEPVMRQDYFEKILEFPQETAEINPAFFVSQKGLMDKVIKSGIKEIKHSLHGDVTAHTAMTLSPPKLFERTLEGMKLIKDAGLRLGIESTFYQGNKHCVDFLADLMVEYRVDDWYIGRVIPVGRAKKWPMSLFLRGEDARTVVANVAQAVARMGENRPKVKFESGWGPNFFSRWHYGYLLGRIEGEPVKSTYYCDAIDTHMLYASTETGRVYPCFYHLAFEDEAIGEWEPERKDIRLKEEQVHKWTAEYVSQHLRGICAKDACVFHDLCLGGCRAEAFSFARRDGDSDPFNAGMDFCITNEIMKTLQSQKR